MRIADSHKPIASDLAQSLSHVAFVALKDLPVVTCRVYDAGYLISIPPQSQGLHVGNFKLFYLGDTPDAYKQYVKMLKLSYVYALIPKDPA